MDEQEFLVLNKLTEAWNEFVKLQSNPNDKFEFMQAIHQAQNIVMARKTARDYPEYFRSEK